MLKIEELAMTLKYKKIMVLLITFSFPIWFTFLTGHVIGVSYNGSSFWGNIVYILCFFHLVFYFFSIKFIFSLVEDRLTGFLFLLVYTFWGLIFGFFSGWAGILSSGYCC